MPLKDTNNTPVKTPQILVVGPAWVGDMVMAQSLFKTLKNSQPGTYLAVLAPAWTHPLLDRMPEVDAQYSMPVGHKQLGLKARWQVAQQIRNGGFDQAIILPNSLKAALIPFFARIPLRTGFVGEQRYGLLNDCRALDKNALPLNVQRFVVLASPADMAVLPEIPQPRLSIDTAVQMATMHRLGLASDRPILALCPGAEFGPSKQWPATHFGELARRKIVEGWQVWVLGSDKDREVANTIQSYAIQANADSSACRVLAGETALGEAVDLLAKADAVVSNDSGLMHVAAALNKKLVAVYGSSSPDFTPPLSNNCEIVRLEMECQPCFKRDCPLGHTRCLQDLSVDQVAALL